MIYPDTMLSEWASNGGITPFDAANVNPASIDLRPGNEFILFRQERRLSNLFRQKEERYEIKADELAIRPGDFVLATTMEYIEMPRGAAGLVLMKSTPARLGVDLVRAHWIETSFEGEITLEMFCHRPATLYAGKRTVQLVLYQTDGLPGTIYAGRYQGQRGPTEAR